MQNDNLQVYRGEDYIINDYIKIHQCSLGEICDFGEQEYFSMINTFTATPTDMKYQLSLQGIDWNTLSDFDLFLILYRGFNKEDTKIIFGDLDFSQYQVYQNKDTEELCLYNPNDDTVIDKSIYTLIASYLRKSHNLKRNEERAMTETTRLVLLDEAKEQYEMNKDKEYQSFLIPLISTMINMAGFNYNHTTIWDMKINAFMDSVSRIQHIKNADLLLQGRYSGFGIDLKKINKKELNYFYESDE